MAPEIWQWDREDSRRSGLKLPFKALRSERMYEVAAAAFDVALQDYQLLPQEGVLGDEMGSTANRILGGSCKQ